MKTNKIANSLSDNSNYILYNTENYKPVIDNTIQEILAKFVSVIIEYMRFISEKITMKNKPYYKFIFERGIETLLHVFSFILYYTKNLELTFYHTQKAYYFYIEFIEQISDENVTFLQLSSRDAIMFVYKKTIFDINNEYKKTIKEPTADEKNILAIFDSYTYIYKNIVQFIINHADFKYNKKTEYINTSCDYIEAVSEILNKNKKSIECIYLFTNLLTDKQIAINSFFILLTDFIKKISIKKKLDEKNIQHKIYSSEISFFIVNDELNKVVDWILVD
jgi:hypothetical protein